MSRNRNFKKKWDNSKTGGKGKDKRKDKEVELDVSLSKLNKADLPHVLTQGPNNDYSWYTKVNPAYKDIASLNFSYPLGSTMEVLRTESRTAGGNIIKTAYETGYDAATVAGVMTIRVAPTIGVSTSNNSAINIGATQLYANVRKYNSGSVNDIDKTDVVMVVTAMDSAYMLFEELVRGYKSLTTMNARNRYLPDPLVQALGFSPQLADSLADLRAVINLFAYQLASINIPDVFSLVKRHSWLFEHVYKDADNAMAQLYAYVPDGFYVWTEGANNQPSKLVYTTRSSLYGIGDLAQVTSISQIRVAINKIMQPILGSQDVGIISGDIAKAYPDSSLIRLQPVAEGEFIEPVYDKEVLLQMSNTRWFNGTILGNDVNQVNTDLTTGPYLTCQPKIQFGDADSWTQAYALSQTYPMLNFIGI